MSGDPVPSHWLTDNADALVEVKGDGASLEKFLEMSTPVLERYKSGFVACMGDIEVCLCVHVEKKELRVQVCHIDAEGQLLCRLEETGQRARQMLKSFILDFPEAVITTSLRKPLCLFSQPIVASVEKSNSLGTFQGYMSFRSFTQIMQHATTGSHKVVVAVP